MADIAVMVIDPGGNRFAQLVDDQLPVRTLIPALVGRLGLPPELNYLIVPAGHSRGLPVANSLAQSGIAAGAQLYLVPARDTVFDQVMKKLYEEARDYAKKKLWEYARQRLELIFRTEPEYPDPAGLTRTVPGAPTPGPPFGLPTGAPAPAPPAAARPTGAEAGAESSAGCFVVLIVVGVIAAAVYWKPWEKVKLPGKQNAPGAKAVQKAETYGVYVGGGYDEVIVGRMSDILDTPTPQLVGWGLDNTKKVKDTGATFRMVLGPFNTADEARRAYEDSKIAGTERDLPLARGTVARFRFDGKDHMIDNATRVLR